MNKNYPTIITFLPEDISRFISFIASLRDIANYDKDVIVITNYAGKRILKRLEKENVFCTTSSIDKNMWKTNLYKFYQEPLSRSDRFNFCFDYCILMKLFQEQKLKTSRLLYSPLIILKKIDLTIVQMTIVLSL